MRGFRLDTCLGLELRWLTETIFSCRTCLLSKKGAALTLVSTGHYTGSLASILAKLPKHLPIALCLSGKGILHKVLNNPNGLEEEQAFKVAFPNVHSNEFYYQTVLDGEQSFVSVIRRSITDPLLSVLRQSGLQIFNFTIGPMVTSHVWSQLNMYGDSIKFDGHNFNISPAKVLLNYNYHPESNSEFEIKIAEQIIAEEAVIAYAVAFQLLLHDRVNLISANVNEIKNEFKFFLEMKKLRQQALTIVTCIFVLLLSSFSVFSHYNSENASLAKVMENTSMHADRSEFLNRQINENESLVNYLGWNGGFNYGFLVNEVGSSLPNSLILKNIQMSDVSNIEPKDRIARSIKIIGNTDSLSAVNNWIFILKDKSWVKAVNLLKYQRDVDSQRYSFSLVLIY